MAVNIALTNLPFVTFPINFSSASPTNMVKATFYLDVEPNIENSTLIDELKNAVVNNALGQFEVDPGTFQAIHRIVGKFR